MNGLPPQPVPGRAPAGTAGPLVLHADAALLVLNKPAGLLTQPGRGPDKSDCLSARVQMDYPEALVVHRLDMGTSGLIVMARGALRHAELSRLFRERRVYKRYEAWVAGHLAGEDEIDLPLIADWPNRPRQIVDHERGKPALTRYTAGEYDASRDATRVSLEPVTGRSHQLRVHLRAIGHPILGDELYAPPAVQACAPRLLLHACELGFEHPEDGRPARWISSPPF